MLERNEISQTIYSYFYIEKLVFEIKLRVEKIHNATLKGPIYRMEWNFLYDTEFSQLFSHSV